MVTLSTADKALKSVYLGVVTEQLNTNANPLLGKINQSSANVWGKEIRKVVSVGINGGIGAGDETGKLPTTSSRKYLEFVSTLKNLYGAIEISDKAMRASQHSSGAFVNLLNEEMESLIKASSFNLGRMLYGDGSGTVARPVSADVGDTEFAVDSVKNLMEGMLVDFVDPGNGIIEACSNNRIISIDRYSKKITVEKAITEMMDEVNSIHMSGSFDGKEITGLGAIFNQGGSLYGVERSANKWLIAYNKNLNAEISDIDMQEAIDHLEEVSGSYVDFITCSSAVKRGYQVYLNAYHKSIETLVLEGGYKAISYNGIPVVSDRFAREDGMYLLNTKEFTLHQLCDWQWLEGDDGKIIKQNAGYPTYSATLVKYADLICDKPNGQALIRNIK